jgi:6-phosphogluconate dehydrogenase
VEIGVIGLRGEGAGIARRLLAAGHRCVVFDTSPRLVAELAAECAFGVGSLRDMAHELDAPRTIVVADPVGTWDATIDGLLPFLEADDIIVSRHAAGASAVAERLGAAGVHYVDIDSGGPDAAMRYLEPVRALIAPAEAAPSR